jgi:hypothetical protein
MVAWPCAVGQNFMVAGVCGEGISSPYGGQEAETEEGAGPGTRNNLQRHDLGYPLPPVTSESFQNLPK